jgi:hypothetical protein
VLLVYLHNPFDGYNTSSGFATNKWERKECKPDELAKYERLDGRMQNLLRKAELTGKCFQLVPDYQAPNINNLGKYAVFKNLFISFFISAP